LGGPFVFGEADGGQGGGLVVAVQDVGKQVSSIVVSDLSKGCDLEEHSTIVYDLKFFGCVASS